MDKIKPLHKLFNKLCPRWLITTSIFNLAQEVSSLRPLSFSLIPSSCSLYLGGSPAGAQSLQSLRGSQIQIKNREVFVNGVCFGSVLHWLILKSDKTPITTTYLKNRGTTSKLLCGNENENASRLQPLKQPLRNTNHCRRRPLTFCIHNVTYQKKHWLMRAKRTC